MGGRGAASHRGNTGGGTGRFAGARAMLERAYGQRHAQAILNILINAPAYVQDMWEEFGHSFRASYMDPNSDEAYYSPATDSVYLGINDVARGDVIHPKYATVFHEYGHMTDYLIARKMGYYNYTAYSDIYNNGLLGSTAKRELEARISKVQTAKRITRNEAAQMVISEAKLKYSMLDRSDISDMFEGAGIGVEYPLGAGHGLSYWPSQGNNREIFAEITSAEAAHPGSLKAIKEYFPETYKVYIDMLKARKR